MSAPTAGPVAGAEYWDHVAADWRQDGSGRLWRRVSDEVNSRLLRRWLPRPAGARALKTDLFDEVASHGLIPGLAGSFDEIVGIDISPAVVELARARLPRARVEVADVRRLPFPDGDFDFVLSISTLDHFATTGEIADALREIARVLRRGGSLLLTLDNPRHPLVALRNALPARLRAALVPFAVGATLGPTRLRSTLSATGFEVSRLSASFHAPRLGVVHLGDLLDRHASAATQRRFVEICCLFEGLARLPSRYLTGCFVAVLACRR